jgi:hypothetical protein
VIPILTAAVALATATAKTLRRRSFLLPAREGVSA